MGRNAIRCCALVVELYRHEENDNSRSNNHVFGVPSLSRKKGLCGFSVCLVAATSSF